MKTVKLYDDSHLFEFMAKVIDCIKDGEIYKIVLDRTAFFPEGGGQCGDTGKIGGVEIYDTQIENGVIFHYSRFFVETGINVNCEIDREPRFRRTQNHSGEHVFSGIANSLYGCENVGFHMGDEAMTIDFDKELSWEELMTVETQANEAVRRNLPIMTSFPCKEELSIISYRSKLDLTENVRIVEITGIDRCACCAPHMERTGDIGIIKILEFERHRGGIRITLVCGMNALDDYRRRQESVTAVSQLLSAKRGDIAPAVERILAEQAKAKERIAALSMELAKLKAEGCAETDGSICLFDNVLDEVAQRELVNMLMEKCGGMAAVFCGSDTDGYRYIIGSRCFDLRKNGKAINSAINGRGGGSTQMIMGRAAAAAGDIFSAIASYKFQ